MLTRRTGDSILIGHDVVVTVLEVRADQVRIGINAPREVQVHREEVFREIARENAAAVSSADRADQLRRRLGSVPRQPRDASRPRPLPGRRFASPPGGQPDPARPAPPTAPPRHS